MNKYPFVYVLRDIEYASEVDWFFEENKEKIKKKKEDKKKKLENEF